MVSPEHQKSLAQPAQWQQLAGKLCRQEAGLGRESQLKQFALKTLPTSEEHQTMALDLPRRLWETAAR
jgi:hypothetical protein